jgi:hypothetical protein
MQVRLALWQLFPGRQHPLALPQLQQWQPLLTSPDWAQFGQSLPDFQPLSGLQLQCRAVPSRWDSPRQWHGRSNRAAYFLVEAQQHLALQPAV